MDINDQITGIAGNYLVDASDAKAFLTDTDKYVTDNGDVDTEAVQRDLTALVEQKPHLAKDKAIDYRTCDDETYHARLAQLNVSRRR